MKKAMAVLALAAVVGLAMPEAAWRMLRRAELSAPQPTVPWVEDDAPDVPKDIA